MAGSVHKGYRLDVELVERIDAWAEAHGMTQAEAVRRLLAMALDSEAAEPEQEQDAARPQADAELRAMLADHIRDLRATISTLTAQVSEKDRQIERLADLADHAQALQAAQAHKQLLEATEAVDAGQQDTQRVSWRARVARWLTGGKD